MPLDVKDCLPRWTKRVVTTMTGRDPLGLSRVSNVITEYLMNGIITTTDRARYYSYYCWAIWHTNLAKPKRIDDFRAGLRRREAAMAIATVLNDSATSPIGVEATNSAIARSTDRESVDCDFQVLPSNPMGGYGQYYAGSLRNLGLTTIDEAGFDQVTELGKTLAEAHDRAIAASPYHRDGWAGRARIPHAVLQESAALLTLDGLGGRAAGDERQRLIELFFTLEQQDRVEAAVRRRESLALLLHSVAFHQKKGDRLGASDLDHRGVYLPYYYDKALVYDKLVGYTRPARGALTARYWRQFCLHQFLTDSMERMLFGLLETIGTRQEGMLLQEAIDLITEPGFRSRLDEVLGSPCETPARLLSILEAGQQSRSGEEAAEYAIASDRPGDPSETAASALALAGLLYTRWRHIEDDAFLALGMHVSRELWAGSFLPALDAWRDPGLSWQEALAGILQSFIIDRHDQVMYEKHRLDSCWLHRQEGRIVKDQDYEPFFRSSRHRNAVRILTDLGLLQVDKDERIAITPAGERVMQAVWG